MHSWDVLDPVTLKPSGNISSAFIEVGILDYQGCREVYQPPAIWPEYYRQRPDDRHARKPGDLQHEARSSSQAGHRASRGRGIGSRDL